MNIYIKIRTKGRGGCRPPAPPRPGFTSGCNKMLGCRSGNTGHNSIFRAGFCCILPTKFLTLINRASHRILLSYLVSIMVDNGSQKWKRGALTVAFVGLSVVLQVEEGGGMQVLAKGARGVA
jgi:hypothetical protein